MSSPSRCILLELVLVMRLILLLISTITTEHDFVLDDARVGLKVRQGSSLTKRPLRNVVHVPFHQRQIFPTEAEAARLSPNIPFSRRMSDLTGAALTSRERFSEEFKICNLSLE